jgi:hypothetical protein
VYERSQGSSQVFSGEQGAHDVELAVGAGGVVVVLAHLNELDDCNGRSRTSTAAVVRRPLRELTVLLQSAHGTAHQTREWLS